MSEIMKELQETFERTGKQLESLAVEIETMSSAEQSFSDLRENLSVAVNTLNETASNHTDFIKNANLINQNFSDVIATIKTLEPSEIKDSLEKNKISLGKISRDLEQEIAINTESFEKHSESIYELKASVLDVQKDLSSVINQNAEFGDQLDNLNSSLTLMQNDLTDLIKKRTGYNTLTFWIILIVFATIFGQILGVIPIPSL